MKWKLNTAHYINDALLEEGTIVGDDCQHNFNGPDGKMYRPSLNMEPADAEAEAYLKEHPRKFDGKSIPTEILQPPRMPTAGQRVGGLGPKPDASKAEKVAGQGPTSGDAAAVDRALVEKALNAPASNPFETK